ncbi:MAG: hypothetical protein ABJE47_13600 [bacterium]
MTADTSLLVIARPDDHAVRVLQQQAGGRVLHASIADLSLGGWHYDAQHPARASAVAAGRVIAARHFAATICRIGVIRASDLPHLHRDDRDYVAAEMNAFLRVWLEQGTAVRFNTPTWVSLAGPAWHPLQWTWFVGQLGVPVHPTLPSASPVTPSPDETTTVTVVGKAAFGGADPVVNAYALQIARAVHSELLGVTFARHGTWTFLSASPTPVVDATNAAAILHHAFAEASTQPARDILAQCAA